MRDRDPLSERQKEAARLLARLLALLTPCLAVALWFHFAPVLFMLFAAGG